MEAATATAKKGEMDGPASKKQRIGEEKSHDLSKLPEELKNIDFSCPIRWGKCAPHPSNNDDDKSPAQIATTPLDAPPVFADASPALCCHVHALSGRVRACTIHMKAHKGQTSRPVPTPVFMPMGTKGCLKGLTMEELTTDPALSCPIVLANACHMALQPGTKLLKEFDGLHCYMGNEAGASKGLPFNLLTDSGGFQMVSLAKLSQVTEEGVTFENPFLSAQKGDHGNRQLKSNAATSAAESTTKCPQGSISGVTQQSMSFFF